MLGIFFKPDTKVQNRIELAHKVANYMSFIRQASNIPHLQSLMLEIELRKFGDPKKVPFF